MVLREIFAQLGEAIESCICGEGSDQVSINDDVPKVKTRPKVFNEISLSIPQLILVPIELHNPSRQRTIVVLVAEMCSEKHCKHLNFQMKQACRSLNIIKSSIWRTTRLSKYCTPNQISFAEIENTCSVVQS